MIGRPELGGFYATGSGLPGLMKVLDAPALTIAKYHFVRGLDTVDGIGRQQHPLQRTLLGRRGSQLVGVHCPHRQWMVSTGTLVSDVQGHLAGAYLHPCGSCLATLALRHRQQEAAY